MAVAADWACCSSLLSAELYQSKHPGPEADEMTTATQLRDALLAMDPLNKVRSRCKITHAPAASRGELLACRPRAPGCRLWLAPAGVLSQAWLPTACTLQAAVPHYPWPLIRSGEQQGMTRPGACLLLPCCSVGYLTRGILAQAQQRAF